jgi:hypothetical protein
VATDWTALAKALGFESAKAMFDKLYTEDGTSVATLAFRFSVSVNTLRIALANHGVQVRARGGTNFQKFVLTEDTIAMIKTDGIRATAEKFRVDYTTVYKAARRAGILTKDPAPAQEPEPAAPGKTEDGEADVRDRR